MDPVFTFVALGASVLAALLATLAARVVVAGLWLAASSASLAAGLYLLGAPFAAVIELSVGAGLVAVLIVFTVATDAEDGLRGAPRLRRWFAIGLATITATVVGYLVLGAKRSSLSSTVDSFGTVFWHDRGLDAFAQLALLFVAALAVVALTGGVVLPQPAPRDPAKKTEAVDEPEKQEVSV